MPHVSSSGTSSAHDDEALVLKEVSRLTAAFFFFPAAPTSPEALAMAAFVAASFFFVGIKNRPASTHTNSVPC